MVTQELEATARALVTPGKGLLAADESFSTIEKRFRSVSIPSTEQTRMVYRELLFSTPDLNEYISGVILFDETLRQKNGEGKPLLDLLQKQKIIPGIKVDQGTKPLPNFPGETITGGMDGLEERLPEYHRLGARFTKWRAVISIGPGIPTQTALRSNAEMVARFAALSQQNGLVPVVEPEVLMEGDHTLEECSAGTEASLHQVFESLYQHRVVLEGILLKPNMVLSGKECPKQAGIGEVAEATLRTLKRAVPAAVPGIMFLSGGQSSVLATQHLNAIARLGGAPWEISFSFGRALQEPALEAWGGKPENKSAAQAALHHRTRCNSLARSGRYQDEFEREYAQVL